MGSKVKRLLGAAAPIVGNLIAPGIGGIIGGAAGGALSGGGLKGALMGGLQGAATGFAPQIGGAVNNALGLNLTSAGGINALGGGLGGLATGALSGNGLRGALMGGVGGAAQGYLGNGGFDDLGLTGENSIFGNAAGSPLSGGIGPTQGSGILGSVTRNIPDLSSALSTGTGGGSSTYSGGNSNVLSNVLSGLSATNANDDAERDLLTAQQKALERYQPYVDAKFNPGDLTQDPGYQFRLQQGTQALNRSLGAKGGLFSGAALKAAQDYGQGLADSTYNDAYNRWLQQNQQNIGVANNLADLDAQGGNVKATAGVNSSNIFNRSLSGILGGYGAYSNQGRTARYDPYTGQPIY